MLPTGCHFVPLTSFSLPCEHLQVTQFLPIGEALNPGPQEQTMRLRIALTNPTSIYSKLDTYRDLVTEDQVSVFACAETAATAVSQKTFGAAIRKQMPFQHWSPPVQDHVLRTDGEPSRRGKAGGTCLLSSVPLRAALATLPSSWDATTRIVHSVLTLGPIQVQMIVVYCLPANRTGAAQFNSDLIQVALDAMAQLPIPGLIMGDFNGDPMLWPCGERLRQLGFLSLATKYRHLYGQDMPPTCKEATITDQALLSLRTHDWVKQVVVNAQYHFDTHKVVFMDLEVPIHKLQQFRYVLPKTFHDFDLDQQTFDECYHQVLSDGKPADLQDWAGQVERAVDQVLRLQHTKDACLPRGLPRKFRGRCLEPKRRKMVLTTFTQTARPGDYMPSVEVHSRRTRRMVQQCRRLEALGRLLRKPALTSVQHMTAVADWKAICRCRDFAPDFLHWCFDNLDLGSVSMICPDSSQVEAITKLSKFHTDAALQMDKKGWLQKLEYGRQLDQRQRGSAKAFARMNTKDMDPLQHVRLPREETAIAHCQEDGCLLLYLPKPGQFTDKQHLRVDDIPVKMLAHDDYSILVEPLQHDHDWPHEVQVTQDIHTSDPEQIMRSLDDYWQTFWNVEHPHTSNPEILGQVLDMLPHMLPKDMDVWADELWIQAVKDLNSRSARGLDAISAAELQMLPDSAILTLRDVVRDDPHCFDELMVAKTHPVPKLHTIVQPHQTRPITVLPQTYRVWSRVVAFVILQHFAEAMPASVTGFLPGRGPMDSSYRFQHMLEMAHATARAQSGICLDLMKCFNTIRRSVAAAILAGLGASQDIIDRWQTALSCLTRTWIVHQQASDPCGTNCHVEDTDLHTVIIALTLEYVNMCGMTIDWKKSWAWATSPLHARQLKQILLQERCTASVEVLGHATELGAHHTYGGIPKLGKIHDRIADALGRLEVLQRMPHSLEVKMHLVRSGVYSVAFYGASLIPLGSSHTDQIRTAVCNALLGPSQSRNNYVAMLCLPELLDPEIFVIKEAILAAKRFVLATNADQVARFLDQVCCQSGKINKSKGPAGALRCYLDRIDWQLTRDGRVQVGPFQWIPLVHLTSKKLTRLLQQAWSQDLLTLHASRKAWKGHTPIHAWETARVLQRFNHTQQRALINEMSGAFQTMSQQSHWDPSVTDRCLHCEGEDTRYHRIFECPATQRVRQAHQPILQLVEEQGLLYHELPVVTEDFSRTILHTICEALPEPEVDETLCTRLCALDASGFMLHFYTDGSCCNPTVVDGSHAAFAVILDVAYDDAERCSQAAHWVSGSLAATLKPFAAGRLPGPQNIHRAELMAAILVCERFARACVTTDSNVVISLARICKHLAHPRQLYMHSEPDLALRFRTAFRKGTYEFRKVKAHQNPLETQDLLLRYDRLGNQMADELAQTTCQHMLPTLVAEANGLSQRLQQQHDCLYTYFQYFLELQQCRAALRRSTDTETHQPYTGPDEPVCLKLARYKPERCWLFPIPTIDHTRDFAWGATWGAIVANWLQRLEWPEADLEVEHSDLGVTWIELSLSLMYTAQMWLPVRRAGADKQMRLVVLTSYDDVLGYNVQFSEFAETTQQMLTQLASLRNTPIHPELQRRLVKSCYALGFSIHSSGLPL
eukprot:Skav200039  [mRNA]  locus=scaffold337:128586:133469:+ [translate_table: standard]